MVVIEELDLDRLRDALDAIWIEHYKDGGSVLSDKALYAKFATKKLIEEYEEQKRELDVMREWLKK